MKLNTSAQTHVGHLTGIGNAAILDDSVPVDPSHGGVDPASDGSTPSDGTRQVGAKKKKNVRRAALPWGSARDSARIDLPDPCGSRTALVPDLGALRNYDEPIRMSQINEAYERMLKSDVKYRFVVDMATVEEGEAA